jgi:DNA-directed RNA polymerase subunit L
MASNTGVKVLNIANPSSNELSFEIMDTDVCVVNSIRRVLLTEVKSLVFRGFPHKENCIKILKNNTKFNNEYIKHRMQCIPIYNNNPATFENFVQKYQLKLNVVNNTNNLVYVTSADFVVYDKSTDKPIANQEKQVRRLFPQNPLTGDFIPICCLKPRITDADDAEEINMVIDFSIGKSKEDACWNMVSKCCYENKKDDARFQRIMKKDEVAVRDHFKSQTDYDTYMRTEMTPEEKRDFEIIESQRVFIPNHYIMYVESIGVYDNQYLVSFACEYILGRLEEFNGFLSSAQIKNTCYKPDDYCIYKDKSTVKPVYVLYVKDDDYTIGKIIEKYLYYMYREVMYYVSFKKEHPHDTFSLISFSYKEEVSEQEIIANIKTVSDELIGIYTTINSKFRK